MVITHRCDKNDYHKLRKGRRVDHIRRELVPSIDTQASLQVPSVIVKIDTISGTKRVKRCLYIIIASMDPTYSG